MHGYRWGKQRCAGDLAAESIVRFTWLEFVTTLRYQLHAYHVAVVFRVTSSYVEPVGERRYGIG